MSSKLMPYEITGSEEGVPIVLVPGGLSGWISWKPHAEVLSKTHKVIRVQLLNMAAAEKQQVPSGGYSLRSESEALENTLTMLKTEEVDLVGWSHGGEVSLDFALNYPERVRTLTLIEPAVYWVARAFRKFEEEERELKNLFAGFHDPPSEDDLIGFLRMNGLVSPGADPRSMPRWPVWNSLKTALLSLSTVVSHTDDLDRLKALLGKPVLLVKGKESVGANSGIVDLLSKAIGSSSKVIILPDGHACHIVAQDHFIVELEQFILSSL